MIQVNAIGNHRKNCLPTGAWNIAGQPHLNECACGQAKHSTHAHCWRCVWRSPRLRELDEQCGLIEPAWKEHQAMEGKGGVWDGPVVDKP